MCYGAHPNDFLFAECKNRTILIPTSCLVHSVRLTYMPDGFFLDENESDAVYLDDIVFRFLSPADQDELKLQQYYGYFLFNFNFNFQVSVIYIYIYILTKAYFPEIIN